MTWGGARWFETHAGGRLTPMQVIQDAADKFLIGSGAAGAKHADIRQASLDQLFAIDSTGLQAVVAFLTESVGSLAGALAQAAADEQAQKESWETQLGEMRAQQEKVAAQLEETQAKVASQEESLSAAAAAADAAAAVSAAAAAAAAAAGDDSGGGIPPELFAQLSAGTTAVQEDQQALRKEFAELKGWAESLQGETKGFEEALQNTKASLQKGDEAERRVLKIEIARVEAEIAKLAAMRAEDVAAAKRAPKKEAHKKTKAKTEEEMEAEEQDRAIMENPDWLEGAWKTKFGDVPGIILQVENGEGTYGREKPPERVYDLKYDGDKVTGRWGAAKTSRSIREGQFEFTASADRKTFTGVYGGEWSYPPSLLCAI